MISLINTLIIETKRENLIRLPGITKLKLQQRKVDLRNTKFLQQSKVLNPFTPSIALPSLTVSCFSEARPNLVEGADREE